MAKPQVTDEDLGMEWDGHLCTVERDPGRAEWSIRDTCCARTDENYQGVLAFGFDSEAEARRFLSMVGGPLN